MADASTALPAAHVQALSTREQLLAPLTRHINEPTLLQLARGFADTFGRLAETSAQHFLATPVTALPTGREKGHFLAIDVGGTNLRVAFVELLGEPDDARQQPPREAAADAHQKIRRLHERAWPIEEHMKMDQAADLFAWIGDCIAGVIADALYGEHASLTAEQLGDEIPMGVTFSFPMTQSSISQATLMPMGKGFAITSDLNLGKMLLAGYARHCNHVSANGRLHESRQGSEPRHRPLPRLRITAITNDTVATYASLAYSVKASSNSRVVMGLVVGTGTNATIPMTVSSLGSFKRSYLELPHGASIDEAKVVVNTEWSVCGTDAPLKQLQVPTIWDVALDRASDAPGFQPVEYMTSGRYLGELVRLALVQFLGEECGQQNLPPALLQRNAVSTTFLSTAVAEGDDASLTANLDELYPPKDGGFSWTKDRIDLLRAVAAAVQIRSAALIAAMIVGLLARAGEIQLDGIEEKESRVNGVEDVGVAEELVVAHTGGVILQYPGYLELCQKWIDTLVAKGSRRNASKRVVLGEAKEGGVIGAAVLAGMFYDRQ